ncbi:MAG: penicillin-insensitive murein endopeptidase [Betaproteobacteria bacterium]
MSITKLSAFALLALIATHGLAQTPGTLNPAPLPPLATPADPSTPAKELFGRELTPAKASARVYGFYSKGCLAGAESVPITGPTWQVMRLSRHRNWGHPELVKLVERLADKTHRLTGWPGILVGDLSQPRGGPMLTGHASHQVGLDADIWLTPMPARELTRQEREEMSATLMVDASRKDVDPAVWTPGHVALIKAAAQEPEVDRIFVNAAIKKALCRDAGPTDRKWLGKVRPLWQHDYHFHIRMRCPRDSRGCTPQAPPPLTEDCGSELDWWFRDEVLFPKPPAVPPKPRTPLTVANLPRQCSQVLKAP